MAIEFLILFIGLVIIGAIGAGVATIKGSNRPSDLLRKQSEPWV